MLRQTRLAQFVSDRDPEANQLVEVLCEDGCGTYVLPFLCRRQSKAWINTKTDMPIEAEVLGWRVRGDRQDYINLR